MKATVLSVPDQKEGLSLAYVRASAAGAGFSTSVPEQDRDSVDLRVMAGGPHRPALDFQLKAKTGLAAAAAGFLRFRLSIKNYNDFRVETQTPRLLVVLELPRDQSQWLTVTAEELVLCRRAYWMSSQQGHEAVAGQMTKTIHVPEGNLFDVAALEVLMDRSRRGPSGASRFS